MDRRHLLFALAPLALAACGPRTLPVRSSPLPTDLTLEVPDGVVVDTANAEPTWYDPGTRRVVRIRGGAVTVVQDVEIDAPESLRVLEDDTILALVVVDPIIAARLEVHAPGQPTYSVDVSPTELAYDGVDQGSIWYASWLLTGAADDYVLCHVRPEGTVCPTSVPNVGGFSPVVGVARDGSVYVNDRDHGLYRYDGAALQAVVAALPEGDFVTGIRHGAGSGLLALGYQNLWAIEGGALRRVWEGAAGDATGSPERFVVGRYDSEWEKVDPGCDDGWFTSCERRTVWSQTVFYEVSAEGTREIGHDDCDFDHPETTPGCGASTRSMAIDGDTLVLVGAPMRSLPL